MTLGMLYLCRIPILSHNDHKIVPPAARSRQNHGLHSKTNIQQKVLLCFPSYDLNASKWEYQYASLTEIYYFLVTL